MESTVFFDFVCSELKVLSDQQSSLPELNKDLHSSQKNKSLRGEILSNWKILDSHFHMNSSKYDWEDELPININKHCEEMTYQNRVSVRTLVFYWNLWKDKVVGIISSLGSFLNEEPNGHVDYSLNYFGVRKQCVKGKTVYVLVNKDADWIRNAGQKGVHSDGRLVTSDRGQLVCAMRSYWQSELLSVGIKVLLTLEGLHKLSSEGSTFHQSTSLLHIFDVSKFLLDCEYLNLTAPYKKKLQIFLKISMTYFDLVFPLDWRKAVSKDLVSLRDTDLSLKLLDEIILQNVDVKGDITYGTIARVMMICLDSRRPVALNEMIIKGIRWDPSWKSVVASWNLTLKGVVATSLKTALRDTFRNNWSCVGYMSPHCFVHLLDRLFFLESSYSGMLIATKSSLVGFFSHLHATNTMTFLQDNIVKPDFIFFDKLIQTIFYFQGEAESWIRRSKINVSYYHPLLVLKLVMIVCLISLRVPDYHSGVLLDMLTGKNNIAYFLPREFVYHLLRKRDGLKLLLSPQMVAEAFMSIGDPLVLVSSKTYDPKEIPSAIFVDFRKTKKEIMSILFPKKTTIYPGFRSIPEAPSSNILPDTNINVNLVGGCKGVFQIDWKLLDLLYEAINTKKRVALKKIILSSAPIIQKRLNKDIQTLGTACADKKFITGNDATEARHAIVDLTVLFVIFDSPSEVDIPSSAQEALERLQMNRARIDNFLNLFSVSGSSKFMHNTGSENHIAEVAVLEQRVSGNTQEARNKKGKGKKKCKKNKGRKN